MSIAVTLIIIAAVAWALAYNRAALWQWAVVAVVGACFAFAFDGMPMTAKVIVGLLAVVLAALSIPAIRFAMLTRSVYRLFVKLLPPMSDTEREALEAGTVWWDAELFAGRPDWQRLLDAPAPSLTAREQAFIDGPLNELCEMVDDWHINRERRDLPPEVWAFIKSKGFLGMIIDEAHGGLGFSAQAQSEVVSILSTRSATAAVTVMVPNSLGPGELLHRFGTEAQKDHYLPRLARGEEIPAFALTGPYAGSDAASMRDTGIVCKGEHEGREVLGVRLTWEKRYITLGPVATVLGMAFKLHDPDGLLGGEEERGITLALIPTDWPGVEIGRRHYPAGQAFQNGPNSGTDVFVPLSFIIGGEEGIGRGWMMLMNCLAAGRAISLPALGTSAAKFAAQTTTAYGQIRKQFNISIGRMEGVEEPLARIVGQAYLLEAARRLTNTALDMGEQPSVISAILKLEATERMRQCLNDAMDIQSGKGICDGPNNILFNTYSSIPVAITVEGANILTRSLIIFAQGSIRCHPWLLKEMQAAKNEDREAGLVEFDKAFGGHVAFSASNFAGALWHNITGARFVPAPSHSKVSARTRGWYKQLGRASQNFALLADITLLLLGGAVKRKQRITARFADALGELYLMSAALKRFEDEGRPEADLPLVKWAMVNGLHRIQESFETILQNYTSRPVSWIMRGIIFPFGHRYEPVRDQLEHEMVTAVLEPGEVRDRLTHGVFTPADPEQPVRLLEDTFLHAAHADEIWKRMRKAVRAGTIKHGYGPAHYDSALDADVITVDEKTFITEYARKVRKIIDVDDFAPEDLSPRAGDNVATLRP